MTFSEQIVYGLTKPSKYKELLQLKTGRFVLYVVVLMLIMGLVGYVVPAAATIAGFGGFESLFTEKMGAMEYDGQELTIEKPFKMKIGSTQILINTNFETIPDEELTDDSSIYMAVGSKGIRLAVPTIDGWLDYMTAEHNQMLNVGFNNESLMEMIPPLYMGLFFSFIVTCIGYFIKYAVFALILSICINSMNKHFGLGLSYGKVFMICFYGESLGMLISNFNIAMGLLPATLVSMITIFISIHIITTSVVMMRHDYHV